MNGLGSSFGHLLPDTAWVNYAYILIAYHLILAFKVFVTNNKAGLSLSIGSTILTHLACVGLLIGFAAVRHQIPFFAILRYFLPGLAPFEAQWLFNGERKKALPHSDSSVLAAALNGAAASTPAPLSVFAASTGEDYEEFLKLMQQGKRPYRKPGITVKQEYELWLQARNKARAKAAVEIRTA